MHRASELTKPYYRVKEAAEILGVSVQTIRNYDTSGILRTERSPGGQRLITKGELIRILKETGNLINDGELSAKRDAIYARAEGSNSEAEISRQVLSVLENVSDLQKPLVFKESSKRSERKEAAFDELINLVLNGKIRNIYITSQKGLGKQGIKYMNIILRNYRTKIITISEKKEKE